MLPLPPNHRQRSRVQQPTFGRLGEAVNLRQHALQMAHLQLAVQVAPAGWAQRRRRGVTLRRWPSACLFLQDLRCALAASFNWARLHGGIHASTRNEQYINKVYTFVRELISMQEA